MQVPVVLLFASVAYAAHLVLPFYTSVYVDSSFSYHGAHEYIYLVTDVLIGSNQQKVEAAISFTDPQSVIYELYRCGFMGVYSSSAFSAPCSTGPLPPFASNESTSYTALTNASWSTQVLMKGFQAWEEVTWASDTFVLSNETFDDITFLVPTKGMTNQGDFNQLGLGLEHSGFNVSSDGVSEEFSRTFGSPLVYSVYINPVDAADGSLVVGGVDHAKYSGPLVYLAPEADDGFYGISINGSSIWNSGSSSNSISFNPDRPFSVLPSAVISNITLNYGWTCSNSFCGGLCDALDDSTFGLVLGNLTVEIPVSNLVMRLPSEFNMSCAIMPVDVSRGTWLYVGETEYLIGADILQYLYVVMYPEDGARALAVANWNTTETDIDEVDEEVPGVETFTPVTTILVAKLQAIKSYNYPVETAPLTDTSEDHKSHSNTGKIVGGVVGGVGGAIVVAVLLFVLWRRMYRTKPSPLVPVNPGASKDPEDVKDPEV